MDRESKIRRKKNGGMNKFTEIEMDDYCRKELDELSNDNFFAAQKDENFFSSIKNCFPCFFKTGYNSADDERNAQAEYHQNELYRDTELSDNPFYSYSSNRISMEPSDDLDDLDDGFNDNLSLDSSKEEKEQEIDEDRGKIKPNNSPKKNQPIIVLQPVVTRKKEDSDNELLNGSTTEEDEEDEDQDQIYQDDLISDDFALLNIIDIDMLKKGLIELGSEYKNYKNYEIEFEKSYKRMTNDKNKRKLDNVIKIKKWVENKYETLREFINQIEEKKENDEYFLALPATVAKNELNIFFSEWLAKITTRYLKTPMPTRFMMDDGHILKEKEDGSYRLLPVIDILPEIIRLKKKSQKS